MKACAFFGPRKWAADEEKELTDSIVYLIENYGVTQFFSGGRGAFDETASRIVGELRTKYPHIKNTLVLSYLPMKKEEYPLSKKYTDSVYLLERRVPPRYAILETNKAMIDRVDFIITSSNGSFGGACKACDYAVKKRKIIFDLSKK